jgi:hypothetical protein
MLWVSGAIGVWVVAVQVGFGHLLRSRRVVGRMLGRGVGYDPDGRLTYVDAVRAIAETDRDGLSSSPQTLSRFLRSGMTSGALLELGFEIARSNSTVMLGENPMSEWIETLIGATDTDWKDKGCDR